MTITRDEIERDRAAGTPGPWNWIGPSCIDRVLGLETDNDGWTEIAASWIDRARIARLPELEEYYLAAEAAEAKLRARIAELEEALIWCSGSPDFNDGGQAREGWLKNVGNDDYTPVTVMNDGEELMVCQIGRTSTLSLGHFPEERWGLEITPPAM